MNAEPERDHSWVIGHGAERAPQEPRDYSAQTLAHFPRRRVRTRPPSRRLPGEEHVRCGVTACTGWRPDRSTHGRSAPDRPGGVAQQVVVGLDSRSEHFRRRWAAHNVRIHTTGVKLLHHPVVGDLDLPFETFPLGADPSQFLLTYTAEPASPTQDALNLLASWAATHDAIDRHAPTNDPESAETID
ncbi:hypothetical protein MTP10_33140 [Nonomuraea sp. 3-1Str]|uniref:MmyB family transcriptional regulator n=1 Tax=Nonomuraea sp. 3-1Str TaxID=2929801 RepID=UPI00285F6935|nr:hypothetical protein [Nonomuraea sp. 3-1Str]MDR8413570.1 hypothetical protein [Nonomuraea sp. 3-1Str]